MTAIPPPGPPAAPTNVTASPGDGSATVQWTAMGDGIVDWKAYFDRFEKLCPGVPVHIETISGFNREISFLKPEFWSAWPKARAVDLARFVALARRGKPRRALESTGGQTSEIGRSGASEERD